MRVVQNKEPEHFLLIFHGRMIIMKVRKRCNGWAWMGGNGRCNFLPHTRKRYRGCMNVHQNNAHFCTFISQWNTSWLVKRPHRLKNFFLFYFIIRVALRVVSESAHQAQANKRKHRKAFNCSTSGGRPIWTHVLWKLSVEQLRSIPMTYF